MILLDPLELIRVAVLLDVRARPLEVQISGVTDLPLTCFQEPRLQTHPRCHGRRKPSLGARTTILHVLTLQLLLLCTIRHRKHNPEYRLQVVKLVMDLVFSGFGRG
ncbi:hypothetical protein GQ457_03G028580 [Hibiscus cannabinus]